MRTHDQETNYDLYQELYQRIYITNHLSNYAMTFPTYHYHRYAGLANYLNYPRRLFERNISNVHLDDYRLMSVGVQSEQLH